MGVTAGVMTYLVACFTLPNGVEKRSQRTHCPYRFLHWYGDHGRQRRIGVFRIRFSKPFNWKKAIASEMDFISERMKCFWKKIEEITTEDRNRSEVPPLFECDVDNVFMNKTLLDIFWSILGHFVHFYPRRLHECWLKWWQKKIERQSRCVPTCVWLLEWKTLMVARCTWSALPCLSDLRNKKIPWKEYVKISICPNQVVQLFVIHPQIQ